MSLIFEYNHPRFDSGGVQGGLEALCLMRMNQLVKPSVDYEKRRALGIDIVEWRCVSLCLWPFGVCAAQQVADDSIDCRGFLIY